MLIRTGYDIRFEADAPVPMLALLSVHPSRNQDLRTPHRITVTPDVPMYDFVDGFGNVCTRVTVPEGGLDLSCDFVVEDSGELDAIEPDAPQLPVASLPDEVLVYLLASRYCETDRLLDIAWPLFEKTPRAGPGSRRSSTSPMTASSSAIITPGRPRPPGTPIRNSAAYAGTSPISPSHCAAA